MAPELDPERARQHLLAADPVLARVVRAVGLPPLRPRGSSPFQSLGRAIIYQQLSGRAAGTIYERFLGLFAQPEDREGEWWFPAPEVVLGATDDELRAAGLSRQKIASIRDLALHFAEGRLSTERFDAWDDEEIIGHLTQVRGVGRWTAEMFLMMHLRRPDVMPVNDVGINRAIKQLYGLDDLPKPPAVLATAEPWRPWATAACLYLWRSLSIEVP
ncbi:MAG: DNA-3-methyladenine glycosylase [Dehalococcoidia bacterium]